MNFQMNQAGIFHLRKISTIVKNMTGARYKLSHHGQIAALVKTASHIDNSELRDHLRGFFLECWPETQNMIVNEALIPGAARLVA